MRAFPWLIVTLIMVSVVVSPMTAQTPRTFSDEITKGRLFIWEYISLTVDGDHTFSSGDMTVVEGSQLVVKVDQNATDVAVNLADSDEMINETFTVELDGQELDFIDRIIPLTEISFIPGLVMPTDYGSSNFFVSWLNYDGIFANISGKIEDNQMIFDGLYWSQEGTHLYLSWNITSGLLLEYSLMTSDRFFSLVTLNGSYQPEIISSTQSLQSSTTSSPELEVTADLTSEESQLLSFPVISMLLVLNLTAIYRTYLRQRGK